MRRIVPLFATLVLAGPIQAQAADSAELLAPTRIAALPAAERQAWERYVETSRRQRALDAESLSSELRAAGLREPIPAPSGLDVVENVVSPERYLTDEARRTAEAIVSYQTPSGGWSRGVQATEPRRPGQAHTPPAPWSAGVPDVRATADRLRYLARADRARPDERYRRAFLRGLEYLLRAQFPNGCWPLAYPLAGTDADAVAFSDEATTLVLRQLRDVEQGGAAFVPDAVRRRAAGSVARGVECVLSAQVRVDGRRTGWGARHDPLTLAPVGTAGDLRALSAWDTPDLLEYLLETDTGDPRVAASVRGAAAWMRESVLWGIEHSPEMRPMPVPGAGPIWAHFYEIGSNRALYAGHGEVRHDWRELPDTLSGIGWFTDEPSLELARYDRWSRARESIPLPPARERADAVVDARHNGPDGETVAGVRTYRTIGAALAAAPADGRAAFVIQVRDGRYREKLSIQKPNLHLIGESRDGTVLTYDVAAGHLSPGGWPYGTRGSWTLHVAAPGFRLERMTVENAFDFMANAARPDSDSTKLRGTQAVAVMLDEGSDRAVFRDCRLSGHQDTLFPQAGRSYFHRCEILGSVDFIFGAGRAVFDDCDIVSRDRGSADNNGYVTAPSTHVGQPYGFVFLGGRLKKETPSMAPSSVTLGRPWHPSGRPDAIGSAVFIGVWMDDHIGATGWSPMNSTDAAGRRVENQPGDARFFEHGTTGPGAVSSPTRRVLTAEQAAEYTLVRVLDGWDPRQ
jgi:pectinesterase